MEMLYLWSISYGEATESRKRREARKHARGKVMRCLMLNNAVVLKLWFRKVHDAYQVRRYHFLWRIAKL